MTTYISILRGINVGGKRLIKMQLLKELYESLGYKNIQTYIQSGNVVFQTTKIKATDCANIISQEINKVFGFDVPIIVLEKESFKAIVQANKFAKDKTKEAAFLHVIFLSDKPQLEDVEKITKNDYGEDAFYFEEKAVYLYCPNGYSNSKLTNGFFESKLQVQATTRNWKTTLQLLTIAESIK